MKKFFTVLALGFLVACSGYFPSAGPSRKAINESAQTGAFQIVPVTPNVLNVVNVSNGYGFPDSFFQDGVASFETIRPGDIVQITIWENVDNGLFATLGNRVTQLGEMKVSQSGTIFVPYVGQIQAANKTTEQLRQTITDKLSPQTPDPQVEVHVVAGKRGGVRIVGMGGAISVPFDEGNLTLAAMLASAGVGVESPRATTITLQRGEQEGKILAQMLYDNPRYDIPLRDGDQIFIEADRRSFKRWLSEGGAAVVPFDQAELTLLDGLAMTGGLNANVSDPSGIFVFREISANQANRLFGGGYNTGIEVVFTIDLRDPNNLFLADDFLLQDDDVVYVTEAPYVSWTRVIGQIAGTLNGATSLTNAAAAVTS